MSAFCCGSTNHWAGFPSCAPGVDNLTTAPAAPAAPAGEAVIKRTFPGGAAAGDPEENVPDWLRNEFEDAGGDDGGRVLASARSQQHHAGRGVGHRFVAYFDNTSYRMEKLEGNGPVEPAASRAIEDKHVVLFY